MSALERHQAAVDAFNAHDVEAVSDVYASDGVLHDPQHPDPISGRDAIRQAYAEMFRSFPDVQVTIRSRHLVGNLLVYELQLTGTNQGPISTPAGDRPATGRRVDLPAAVFADLDIDGRFLVTRRYYDVAAMVRQLGLAGG